MSSEKEVNKSKSTTKPKTTATTKPKTKTKNEHDHNGHRERMRERFIKNQDGDEMADHELLEMLLYYVYPRQNTNEIAHDIIKIFNSFDQLLEADVKTMQKECGINERTAVLIALNKAMSKRYLIAKRANRTKISSTSMAKQYCAEELSFRSEECFLLICLDSQNNILYSSVVAEGTVNSAVVSARTVVEIALRYKSVSVIISHNHPRGSSKPSTEDVNLTNSLHRTLRDVEVSLIEHVIVGENSVFSFNEEDLIGKEV